MRRSGYVFYKNVKAGTIWQDEDGYGFAYDAVYLQSPGVLPVSLSLPLCTEPYLSNALLPFFENLLPAGWIFAENVSNEIFHSDDKLGRLLKSGKVCTGAVSIEPVEL